VRDTGRVETFTDPAPGALWLPPPTGRKPPLILLGHGGSGHKLAERLVRLAEWFTGTAGLAAVALDGPYHGDRAVPGDYHAHEAAEGHDVVLDRMTREWTSTVDMLADRVDVTRLGYYGLSMGTRFGLPVVAALGERVHGVVLGKFGVPPAPRAERVLADAARVTAPTLHHVQWNDTMFPRDTQLALFEALGTRDKRLLAYPGDHTDTNPEAVAAWREFLARTVAPSSP
jgi:dienelactone hydrolase